MASKVICIFCNELWKARKARSRFIDEGRLSAMQFEGDTTNRQTKDYVRGLFEKMKPGESFIYSLCCITTIVEKRNTFKHYRDW